MPQDLALLDAWAHFHNGAFEHAYHTANSLGEAGVTLANRATCAYAEHLEPDDKFRLELFLEVARRCDDELSRNPSDANLHYQLAFALGRYSQGISVAKALAQGLGSKVKHALEEAIRLQPAHAEACIALGAFHAEVIDKVGLLIAAMTYGAKRDISLRMFARGMELLPRSPVGLMEYALALIMLDGEPRRSEAHALYAQAAELQPVDALDFLNIQVAKAGLPPEPDPLHRAGT